MTRAEFIACSLAFHALLLVTAFLVPAPFPTSRAFTPTDLSYVEITPVGMPEDAEAPAPAKPVAETSRELLERLVPVSPGRLTLNSRVIGIGERIKNSARSTKASQAVSPRPEPETGRVPHAEASPQDRAVEPSKEDAEPSAKQPPEESGLMAKVTDAGKARGVITGRSTINFRYQAGWPAPAMVRLYVEPGGGEGLAAKWDAGADKDWIVVSPYSGTGSGFVEVGVFASSLPVGYHEGALTLTADETPDIPARVSVSVMVLPKDPGRPELPHSSWDDYMDGSCKVCHLPGELMPSSDFMSRPEFCGLCHNPAGMASGALPGPGGHPVMVNVTSGGARSPSGGTIDSGPYSDRMATHLLGGDKVVCVTCHNVMQKPGDFGRSWELTYAEDSRTYRLSKGGWSTMGYLVPKVYATGGISPFPERLAGLKEFEADPSSYVYDEIEGTVIFNRPLPAGKVVYVTLSNPYLRTPSANNALCYDCHFENTHQRLDCLVCHAAHGTGNMKAVRERIRTGGGRSVRVVFGSYTGSYSFAGIEGGRTGVCEACHEKAGLHNGKRGGVSVDYTGKDCTVCHGHDKGFGV